VRSRAAVTILSVAAMACQWAPRAAAGTLGISDSILEPYTIGAKFDPVAASGSGFEVTDTFRLDDGGGEEPFLRHEHEIGGTTYFVETSARLDLIYSKGWTRTLPKAEADSLAALWLGRLAQSCGFPSDVIADDSLHAVAWTDPQAGNRLELIVQLEDPAAGAWEVSAVLRRQDKPPH